MGQSVGHRGVATLDVAFALAQQEPADLRFWLVIARSSRIVALEGGGRGNV